MKNKVLKTLALLAALGLPLVVTGALTESGLRSALLKWMRGDRIVENPWTETVDFIVSHSVLTVDTFADLATIPATGRSTGARVRTRGYLTAGDGGGADYVYDSTSAATTNTFSVIAATGGGRYSAISPVVLRVLIPWDPGSLITNRSLSVSSNFVGASAGDLVLVSHPNIGNQADVLMSGRASNNLVMVTFYNNSGATIDVESNTVKALVFKY